MRTRLLVVTALVTLTTVCFAGLKEKPLHRWDSISYPPMPAPWGKKNLVFLSFGSGQGDANAKLGLWISVSPSGAWVSRADENLPEASAIRVRLHRPDGTVVESKSQIEEWSGVGHARAPNWYLWFQFPWGPDSLEEAWVELRFPKQTYWLEIPYGFTRDPSMPLPSHDGGEGFEPALAAGMKDMPATDRIVPWGSVDYDLGVTENRWRLSIKMTNSLDSECEVSLYREDRPFRDTKYSSDLLNPRTSVWVQEPGEPPLTSRCMSIRNREDGMGRSDTFRFQRGPRSARTWGLLKVKVGGKAYRIFVPSSMYKNDHGTAEPNHKQRIPGDPQ